MIKPVDHLISTSIGRKNRQRRRFRLFNQVSVATVGEDIKNPSCASSPSWKRASRRQFRRREFLELIRSGCFRAGGYMLEKSGETEMI